jgi:hypothetical protein
MKLKKDRVITYLVMSVLVGAIIFGLYSVNNKFTGFAVFGEYTNQTSCEDEGYVWENLTEQNCTIEEICTEETIDCEPCLEYEDINGTQGDCISWSSCNNETCIDQETCVDVVIGGQCVGDVCDSEHLNLCLDETNCTGQQGHWYNEVCNVEEEPSCSNNISLCLDETNCTGQQGYWYDEICNVNECVSNDNCASDYECNENGVCVEVQQQEETQEETIEEEIQEEIEEVEVEQETQEVQEVIKLTASGIQNLIIHPNETEEINWTVKNTWTSTLHYCKFKSIGEFSSWINHTETKTLNAGEEHTLIFDINVPEETGLGIHNLEVLFECPGASTPVSFVVEVRKKKLDFELIKISEKIIGNDLKVTYYLEELDGVDQDVELEFIIFNSTIKEAEAKDNQTISANDTDKFTTIIPINESENKTIEGNLSLLVNFNSEVYSGSIQEEIVLRSAGITGFGIFGEDGKPSYVLIFILVIAVLIAIFFITRRLLKRLK